MTGLFEVPIPTLEPEEDVQLFGYALSRDLKVSLRSILGFGQHLAEGRAATPECGQYPMKICESAQWLERQMDALANYARFCSRRVELGTVELSPLMRGVSLQQLEKSGWPEDCVEFVGAFPTARADRAVLKIVFAELFENALRFCAPGQRPQISVRAEVCEGRVEITIRDRGIGIPEHCLPLLGNPFQKFHPGPGVGLGLTLVRRALAAIQGRLLCSSVAGQGSTFQVSLEAG